MDVNSSDDDCGFKREKRIGACSMVIVAYPRTTTDDEKAGTGAGAKERRPIASAVSRRAAANMVIYLLTKQTKLY